MQKKDCIFGPYFTDCCFKIGICKTEILNKIKFALIIYLNVKKRKPEFTPVFLFSGSKIFSYLVDISENTEILFL